MSRLLSRRVLVAVVLLVVVVVGALRAGAAKHDFVTAFDRVSWGALPWLAASIAAQSISFLCYASAQRRLLGAGGARIGRRVLTGLTVASTGVSALVPGGVIPASGWLIGQYRRRGVPVPLAVWSVLAGGFAATVSALALVIVGAGIAPVGNAAVLVLLGVVLVGGSAGFVVMVHRLDALEGFLARHHARRGVRLVQRLAGRAGEVLVYRASRRGGVEVFAFSTLNWLFDGLCLISAFKLIGLGVPWRGVLFAYALSQVAGSLIPLPAGIGVVEGGLVGALALTGTPAGSALAAVVVYRVISYWAVAAVGTVMLVLISHRAAAAEPGPASLDLRPGATLVASGPEADAPILLGASPRRRSRRHGALRERRCGRVRDDQTPGARAGPRRVSVRPGPFSPSGSRAGTERSA